MKENVSVNHLQLRDWIAFDLEWIEDATKRTNISNHQISPTPQSKENGSGTSVVPDLEEIFTFGYEDSYGNTGVIDISDFPQFEYPNPRKAFLEAIKERMVQYSYCFAWGSKATRRKNEGTGKIEGIDGDLVVLDKNFRICDVPSLVRYDDFSGRPYIWTTCNSDSSTTTKRLIDIDLLQVFAKPLVRTIMFKNRYKGLHLDEVATALLGYGKLDYKSGASIQEMSIEERKRYCENDAHLVAELVRIQNGDILKTMKVIADHTKLRLEEVCHKGMSGIWTKILNDEIGRKIGIVGYDNIPFVLKKLYSTYRYVDGRQQHLPIDLLEDEYQNDNDSDIDDEDEGRKIFASEYIKLTDSCSNYHENDYYDLPHQNNFNSIFDLSRLRTSQTTNGYEKDTKIQNKYKGGLVLEPARGLHLDVHVFDVTSLYPTMIIKYNLSPETVNCRCCKDDVTAKEYITSEITGDCKYSLSYNRTGRLHTENDNMSTNYWICQRRQGLFPKILQQLTDYRISYKNQKLKVESQAIKAIINSGYGVFGHPYFKYYDPRVAELVTSFGRYTFTKMMEIAQDFGFTVLYGDTDSIFVNGLGKLNNNDCDCEIDARKFIERCRQILGLDITHENIFYKLVLVGKKHYIGIPCGGEAVIKGMEGIKSDRPEFVRRTFLQMVGDIKDNFNPLHNIRKSLDDLNDKRVSIDQLAISLVLHKNPDEYVQLECKQRRLGLKRNLRKGDTLVYYKTDIAESFYDPNTRQMTHLKILESDNSKDVCYSRYKELLLNSVKDVLEILGYDLQKDLHYEKRRLKDSVYFGGNGY